jgi:hypothetical protein
MYYERYSDTDDLSDHSKVRDSARAWVLGDYLDAPEFKMFALKHLFDIHGVSAHGRQSATINPETIDYVCSNSNESSEIYKLYQAVVAAGWSTRSFVKFDDKNKRLWNEVWDKHSGFRNNLFEMLYVKDSIRSALELRQELLDEEKGRLAYTQYDEVLEEEVYE